MIFNSISFKPIAHLRFDLAEVSVLRRLAESHYDSKVKALANPDRGLLKRLYNFTRNTAGDDTPAFYKFSWDDIDTLAKACEESQYLTTPKQREIGLDLGWRFHQVLRAMRENRAEEVEINENILPGPWRHNIIDIETPAPMAAAAVSATLLLFNTGTAFKDHEGRVVTDLEPSEDGAALLAEFDGDDAESYLIAPHELVQAGRQ